MSTTGVGTRGAGTRDTTRFLGSRFAAARCGLGAITSTCGRTVPSCAGGSAAFLGGSGEGASPALSWEDGSAASGGFSAAGCYGSASNASDSGRATASDVINLAIVTAKSDRMQRRDEPSVADWPIRLAIKGAADQPARGVLSGGPRW